MNLHVIEIEAVWSTDQIEAVDTYSDPLTFTGHPDAPVGQYVNIRSTDGDWFIGHIVDTDEAFATIYVELS